MILLTDGELAVLSQARRELLYNLACNQLLATARGLAFCGVLQSAADLLAEIDAFMRAERKLLHMARAINPAHETRHAQDVPA